MGASGWSYFIPYQEDVYQALQELREIIFEQGAYYKPAEFYGKILESEVGQNMSPDLRGQLKTDVEKMRKQPKPNSIDELIELNGESGTHSILDIQKVASSPDFGVVAPLSQKELRDIFGTERPNREMVENKAEIVKSLRGRWQGTYIIVYNKETPKEIFFTGFSGD
jgi:hypothetical protein